MTPEALECLQASVFDVNSDDLLANHSVLNADEYYEQQKGRLAAIDGRVF